MLVEQILPIARKRLFVVGADAPLFQAAAFLGVIGNDLLVVCDSDNHLTGVITKTDVVRKIAHCDGGSCREKTATVMNNDVISCEPDARLQDVWLVMKERNVKNVPVVDADATPLGVLNVRDALELLLSESEYEADLLRDYVGCTGYH